MKLLEKDKFVRTLPYQNAYLAVRKKESSSINIS